MGQAAGVGDPNALDWMITNALMLDYTGAYKPTWAPSRADRAMERREAGVTLGMTIGVMTEVAQRYFLF